jgi:hypothetical protein
MSGKIFNEKNKFTSTNFGDFNFSSDHSQTNTLPGHFLLTFDHLSNPSFSIFVGSDYLRGDNMFSNFTPNTDLVPLITGYKKCTAAVSEIESFQNVPGFQSLLILHSILNKINKS